MKNANITLRAVVAASPRLLEGVATKDVQYFMDIAAQEKEWAVALALKKILQAEEARQKEEAARQKECEAVRAARKEFTDGNGGYLSFIHPGIVRVTDYKGDGYGGTLRAAEEFHVSLPDWEEALKKAREAKHGSIAVSAALKILDLFYWGENAPEIYFPDSVYEELNLENAEMA